MKSFVLQNLIVGCIAAVIVAVICFIPIISIFAWLIAIGMYIWIADRIAKTGARDLIAGESPNIAAMGWGALTGAVMGIVGALVSLIINLLIVGGSSHHPEAAATGIFSLFGAVGNVIDLFIYPVVGIIIVGLFGLIFGNRLQKSP